MLSCSLKTCGEFLRRSEGHFQIAFQGYDGSSLYSQPAACEDTVSSHTNQHEYFSLSSFGILNHEKLHFIGACFQVFDIKKKLCLLVGFVSLMNCWIFFIYLLFID